MQKRAKVRVMKTSPDEEQRLKDEAFLKLKPKERLVVHEKLRKKIWGPQYNKHSLKGLKVIKRQIAE